MEWSEIWRGFWIDFKSLECSTYTESHEFITSILLASPGHSIINRVESWSGVEFGDFGVEFSEIWSHFS